MERIFRLSCIALASLTILLKQPFVAPAVASSICQGGSIENVSLQDGVSADVKFAPTAKGTVNIAMSVFHAVDRATVISEYRAVIASKLPSDECGFTAHLNNTYDSVRGGIWYLVTGIKSRKYLCAKMTGTCCKWLNCRRCDWIVSNEDVGFQKTLDLTTRVVPAVKTHVGGRLTQLIVDQHTDLEDLQPWESALLDIIRFGGALVKVGTFNLVDITEAVDFTLPTIPATTLIREKLDNPPNLHLVPEPPQFGTKDTAFGLLVVERDERSCAVAEEFYLYLKTRENLWAQAQLAQTTYAVKAGDRLWGIAERVYGDGRYYLPLAQYNDLSTPDHLTPEQRLEIPTLAMLQSRADIVAEPLDSLWKLSHKYHIAYDELSAELKRKKRNPDLIFPAEVISWKTR